RRGQAPRLPPAGAPARGQHHRQQGERRRYAEGSRPAQGRTRAYPRAGGEPGMTPFPVVLSAPSGAGKTTSAHELMNPRDDVGYSVSCTTRAPRPNENNGVDYYFVSDDEFVARMGRDEFAESALVHGRRYGTLRSEVQRVLDSGKHVLMDIDVQGAAQFV